MKKIILFSTVLILGLMGSISFKSEVNAQNPDPDICNRAHYYEDWAGTGPYVYCSGMPTNCYCAIIIRPGDQD